MPRVTSNVARLKRKNKIMKLAKGYWGGRSKLWKAAIVRHLRRPPLFTSSRANRSGHPSASGPHSKK